MLSLLFVAKQSFSLSVLGPPEKLLLLALYQDFTYVSTILKQDNRRVATRFSIGPHFCFYFSNVLPFLMIDFIGSIKCRLKRTSELEIKLLFFRNKFLLPSCKRISVTSLCNFVSIFVTTKRSQSNHNSLEPMLWG